MSVVPTKILRTMNYREKVRPFTNPMIMNKKNLNTKQYFICLDYDFRELPNTLGEHGKLFQNVPNFKKEAFRTRKKLLSESLKINEFINSGIRIPNP